MPSAWPPPGLPPLFTLRGLSCYATVSISCAGCCFSIRPYGLVFSCFGCTDNIRGESSSQITTSHPACGCCRLRLVQLRCYMVAPFAHSALSACGFARYLTLWVRVQMGGPGGRPRRGRFPPGLDSENWFMVKGPLKGPVSTWTMWMREHSQSEWWIYH